MSSLILNIDFEPDIEDTYEDYFEEGRWMKSETLEDSETLDLVYSKLKELLTTVDVEKYIKFFPPSDKYDGRPVIDKGEITIYDERGRCKDLNIVVYDNIGRMYDFNWYGSSWVRRIWEEFWDEYNYRTPCSSDEVIKHAVGEILEHKPNIVCRLTYLPDLDQE